MIPQQRELIKALEGLQGKLATKKSVPFMANTALSMMLNELRNRDLSEKKIKKLWKKYYQLEKEIEKAK